MGAAPATSERTAANVWVLFEASGAIYAVPSEVVLAIHDVPVITPLPFAPGFVDGLIGVPGSVCVLIDLPRRLDAVRPSRRRPGQAAIRLTADHGSVALRVDRVLRLARFDRISWHAGSDSPTGAEPLPAGVVGIGWAGDQPALLLDPEHLVLSDLGPTAHADLGSEWVHSAVAAEIPQPEERRLPFLIIENAGQLYAVPVADLLEVVPLGAVTAIPMAPASVAGLTMLREMPLLLVWLDRLLGQAPGACSDYIIMALGELRFGLAVGRVVRLERLPVRPQQMATPLHGRLDSYYVLDDGSIAHLLSLTDFLDPATRAAIRGFAPGSYDRRLTGTGAIAQKRLLVFRIGGELCALPIEEVQRVAPLHQAVELPPTTEADADRAVEIGGEIVPVSSLRRLFGLAPGHDANCIVVRSSQGTSGLGVDAIVGLTSVPLSSIETAGNPRGPIREFARQGDQLLWILSTQAIAGAADAPP